VVKHTRTRKFISCSSTLEANSETRLHSLVNTTERYVILSGKGLVTVGEASWQVSEGDVVIF